MLFRNRTLLQSPVRVLLLLLLGISSACQPNGKSDTELVAPQKDIIVANTDSLRSFSDSTETPFKVQAVHSPADTLQLDSTWPPVHPTKVAMAYHIPDSMQQGKTHYAHLMLGGKQTQQLAQKLDSVVRQSGLEITDKNIRSLLVRYGQSMKASLIDPTDGHQFRIVALSAEYQTISHSSDTLAIWQWAVTPLQTGTADLVLSVEIEQNGHSQNIPVFTQTVHINRSHKPVNWLPILSMLALLLLLGFAARWAFARWRTTKSASKEIFISYRRADSAGFTISMYQTLKQRFGARVFKDIEDIAAGRDFREVIHENLLSSKVVLVVIGRQWLSLTDEAGKQRIFDPEDFVQLEVATALQLKKNVIPVLVDGATMPSAEQLPEPLRNLAFHNAANLPHQNWDTALAKLIQRIHELL